MGLPGRSAQRALNMALAARCPECGALFRVVADQLKLRGGLVRCGACREVFDAIGSLSYVDDQALQAASVEAPVSGAAMSGPAAAVGTAPAPQPVRTSPAAMPAAAHLERLEADIGASSDRGQDEESEFSVPTLLGAAPMGELPASGESSERAGRVTLELNIVPGLERQARAPYATAFHLTLPGHPSPGGGDPVGAHAADGPLAAAPIGAESPADAEAASFLLQADTPGRRRLRWAIGLACVPLAALAAAQLALALRESVLEIWPQTRPALVRACAWYGCAVAWPAHAELLAIVGSELTSIPGTDVIELNAAVRSRAPFAMALPAIEVTLTDTQNRTIARKVFLPADYLASSGEASTRIDEGLAPDTDFSLHLVFEARGLNAAGFVVYPFYL